MALLKQEKDLLFSFNSASNFVEIEQYKYQDKNIFSK